MLSRKPVEGDFPLLLVRKRGPYSIPCIINMSTSVDHFIELIHIHFSARTIKRISVRTKNQSTCPTWYIYKRCCISGTTARYILNQNLKGITNQKLNHRLTRSFLSNFRTDAMQYGIDQEPVGLRVFFDQFKRYHKNAKFHTVGLTLYKDAPYIGASPDALVSCDCCTEPVIVELKCPFRLSQVGVTSWRLLEYLDENQVLRKNHSYYHQVSLYLGVFNLKRAHFVIYAKGEIISQIIHFDKEFFKFQIQNLQEYYLTRYLPSVIGKKL